MATKKITIGTRGSKLALWQAEHIAARIRELKPEAEVELKRIVTTGDRILDVPLAKIGGKGLFTKELEVAMLAGEIDLAVHSLKDMPVELPEGLAIAAVTTRLDPGDALISPRWQTIDALPEGAKVGTSSLRRRAQLLRYRPDLKFFDLRGNLDTRLKRLDAGEFDAILLATAGLRRLGWEDRITQQIPVEVCLPAMGQGVLAIETRVDDEAINGIVKQLNDPSTASAVEVERAFLAEIQGGCQVPVGIFGYAEGEGLRLDAIILSLDGKRFVKDSVYDVLGNTGLMGVTLARRMMAAGGGAILSEIK